MTQPFALLLSVLVEAPIGFAFAGGRGWGRAGRGALAAAVGTAFTHLPAWHLVILLADPLGYWAGVLLTEGAVVLIECLFYRAIVPLPLKRALLASLAANAASTGFGLLLYALDLA